MLTEFEIIERYFARPARSAVLGVGDDAALVAVRRGCELVVSTDLLVAGRHFTRDADPYRLGHKALAVNLSDLAAMGATPRWATLALALPRADARWLERFSRGFLALARRSGVDLIGGDTTRGPLAICVQIMGEVPRGAALTRAGARAGDEVWVSGTLGDAALAVAAQQGRLHLARADRARCKAKLDAPQPRIALGRALRGIARSAIDISDGLVADLGHICERSRVAAEIHIDALPVSGVMRRHPASRVAREALLAGGDDYELCFTAASRARRAIERIARRLGTRLTRIGRIVRQRRSAPAVTVRGADGAALRVERGGYDHFR